MSNLPAIGTLSYNGTTFDETSIVQVQSIPELDSSKRNVAFVRHHVSVDGYVTASTPANADAALTTYRQNLQAIGGQLVLTGKGFGDLSVNDPDGEGKRDVIYGPVPKLLNWLPLGGGIAAKVKWECDVHIPTCATASYQGIPMEANYKLSWAIDGDGYTKRTYNATLRIPATRQSVDDRTIPDDADTYFEEIFPELIPGFRRTQNDRNIDASKTQLDVTIVDQQMEPNAPPPGVIDVRAEHTISTSKILTNLWSATLNAEYRMQRGVNPTVALNHFWSIFALRSAVTKQFAGLRPNGVSTLIPHAFSMKENIYNRSASFSLSYSFAARLTDIVVASDFWTPIPQSDWDTWAAAMQNGPGAPYQPRGVAGLMFVTPGGELIDLCQVNQGVLYTDGSVILNTGRPGNATAGILDNIAQIDPDSSWISYTCMTSITQADATVELKPLPSLNPGNPVLVPIDPNLLFPIQPPAIGGAQLINEPIGGVPVASITSIPAPIISTIDSRTAPTFFVNLRGSALRVGYPIGFPILLGVGSAIATPCNDPDHNFFTTGVVGQWSGIPVIAAEWDIRWILDRPPDANLPILNNPMLSMPG